MTDKQPIDIPNFLTKRKPAHVTCDDGEIIVVDLPRIFASADKHMLDLMKHTRVPRKGAGSAAGQAEDGDSGDGLEGDGEAPEEGAA